MHLITLTPAPPYNFDLLLRVAARYHPALDVVRDGAYYRALRVGASAVLLRVTSAGSVDAPLLHTDLLAGTLHDADRPALLATLAHILSADEDRASFFAYAQHDPTLAQIVAPLRGLPGIRMASMFEALTTTIIEQQIALAAAVRAARWLVAWGGAALAYDGEQFGLFPLPEQLAAARVEDLTPLKITFRRMALLIEAAGQVTRGDLPLEALRASAPQEAYHRLRQMKGIGHWTAAWTLIKGMGDHSRVFPEDVALQAAVNRYFYGGQGRIPPQQVTDTFAPHGAYAGLGAYYTITRWLLDRY